MIFKPKADGKKLTSADVMQANVIKIDQVADLALVKLASVPSYARPIELGDITEIQIGADVHAIGHPTGEAWTYTKGIISQVRKGYKWQAETGPQHEADVIQTQTPINPGNSGGPLISDSGHLIGVNSFKAKGEALNFAVSVEDVKKFVSRSGSRTIAASSKADPAACKPKVIYEGRSDDGTATLKSFDLDCDGKLDAVLVTPDDKKQPISLLIDHNGDGKPDEVIVDLDRDGRWDVSYIDSDYDGTFDLVGAHPDGKLVASSYKPYVASAHKPYVASAQK